ncbi:MAG: hypothetical protein H7227_00455 [Actinobacteria bacterium]|nr:hypothetical protein [Actinomycetota bacterium]
MTPSPGPDEYSEVADAQLDQLEKGPDAVLYNQILNVCEQILDNPASVRKFSATISTTEGVRFRTPIPGQEPYKIFWSMSQASSVRIEAVFPYPT